MKTLRSAPLPSARRHHRATRVHSNLLSLAGALLLLAAGCDSPGGDAGAAAPGATAGTLVLGVDQGIKFASQEVIDNAQFKSDLYAVVGDTDSLRLSSGGSNIIDLRPVNWFVTGGGGIFTTFGSLDEVPSQKPLDDQNEPLPKAKAHNGFVLLTEQEAWVKGWLETADGSAATVHYTFID